MIAERALDTMKVAAREQVLVAMLGIPRLLRHRVWTTVDTTQGQGLGVLLVPGFGASDHTLTLTGAWLRARGYRPTGAGIGFTVGCTTDLVDRLERRLEEHAEATGGQVVLIGQSRGGTLARLLAVRRPDLVRGLVMLGSPVVEPLNAQRDVMAIAGFLARLSTFGVPGLMNGDCFSGDCYRTNISALAAPLEVPALSVYSRSDGIVPWQCSLDPYAEHLEVRCTHTGMAFEPAVYRALDRQLVGWADSHALAAAC